MNHFNPQISLAKMLIKKILKLHNCEFIEFSYIFETQQTLLTANGQNLNSDGHKIISDIFMEKMKKAFNNSVFIVIKIYHDRIEGEHLKKDNTKEPILIKF
jgi:hypothetical protein